MLDVEKGARSAEHWNLVAAGPSREHLRAEHFLDGPVVTINRAIDIVTRNLRVDFAAFADGPGQAWIGLDLERFWRPGIVLWVSAGYTLQTIRSKKTGEVGQVPGPPFAKLWDQALPASIGFRLMPYGILKDDDAESKQRWAFTAFCALHGIARFMPKTIRILSMDMAGSWVEGLSEEECLAHDLKTQNLNRWSHERRVMQREINRMRGEGIRVETVTPEPLIVAA